MLSVDQMLLRFKGWGGGLIYPGGQTEYACELLSRAKYSLSAKTENAYPPSLAYLCGCQFLDASLQLYLGLVRQLLQPLLHLLLAICHLLTLINKLDLNERGGARPGEDKKELRRGDLGGGEKAVGFGGRVRHKRWGSNNISVLEGCLVETKGCSTEMHDGKQLNPRPGYLCKNDTHITHTAAE